MLKSILKTVLSNQDLTPRESEILRLVVKEYTSTRIAKELNLSVRTVETHRKNIVRKTSCHNLVGLIKFAIRAGMMEGFYFSTENLSPDQVPGDTYFQNALWY
ncbi:MAG TPA: LuxR C-terminal-related transcriptional regulator [Bacteroidia bacterium]|nr:LuxR C-terminal-related transcriptional regulator [Bacteroidia bacterium]